MTFKGKKGKVAYLTEIVEKDYVNNHLENWDRNENSLEEENKTNCKPK